MLPDSPQVARWQRTLDRTFPSGAVCSWINPGQDPDTIYLVPRIEVVSMARLDPVVRLAVDGVPRVLGPWRVISYVERSDGNYLVRFDDITAAMLWSPRVPDRAARGMARQRQELLGVAPGGGRAIYEDPDG